MDELKSHLVAVNPKYDEYADPLWSNGVKSVRQIAHASAESLQAMGVDDLDRAEIIHRDARLAELKGVSVAISDRAAELSRKFQAVAQSVQPILEARANRAKEQQASSSQL